MRKHGYFGTPTYTTWIEMRRRCYDPKRRDYKNYGGRGVRVCLRWTERETGFLNFLADMGERPAGKTIGRKDNDRDYTPDNCRWETVRQQNRNRSNSVFVSFRGRRMSLTCWAARFGLSVSTIKSRLRRGWTITKTFTEAAKMTGRRAWPRKEP